MNEINLNNELKAKKLFLVGFMASGKTTIGKKISSKLNIPFFDSDKELEIFFNTSINDFFKAHGENKFRELEEKVILDKIKSNNMNGFVMSLGGGAYLNKNVRRLIDSVGISIWLNGNIDIIYNRIIKSKNERPLAKKFDSKEKLKKLLNERVFYYQKASIKVNIIKTSKEKMTEIILKKINNHINKKND